MKLIEKIYQKKDDISKEITHYIGLNKLTCDDCYSVISILNNEGHKWKVCGRHGSGSEYTEGWEIPTFMQGREREIKEWKEKNRTEKVKETTSKIPEKLSDLNLLLEELKSQESQTQIEQPPYGTPGSSKK